MQTHRVSTEPSLTVGLLHRDYCTGATAPGLLQRDYCTGATTPGLLHLINRVTSTRLRVK